MSKNTITTREFNAVSILTGTADSTVPIYARSPDGRLFMCGAIKVNNLPYAPYIELLMMPI